MKRLILALALALACVRPAAADRFTQLLLGVDTTPTPSPVCIMSPTGICAAQLGTWNIGTSTWTPAGGGGGGGGLTVGTTTIASGTNGYIQYNNGGLLGEKATTGTGNVVLSASPTFSGTIGGTQVVPYSALVNVGANTVLGQVLAGTPTQLPVPSCSGTVQALNWTIGGGFGCSTLALGAGMSNVYDITSPTYGCVASTTIGSANQATCIQSAINAAYAAGGGIVWVPSGFWNLTSQVIVKVNVALQCAGNGRDFWSNNTIAYGTNRGSILAVNWGSGSGSSNTAADAAIQMQAGSRVLNCGFWYPNQNAASASTPIEYGPTILDYDLANGGINMEVGLNHCYNCYDFIDFRGSISNLGQDGTNIHDNTGSPIYRCISINFVGDWITTRDNKFNSAGLNKSIGGTAGNLIAWAAANGQCFYHGFGAWTTDSNNSAFGYYTCHYFDNASPVTGFTQGGPNTIVGGGCDATSTDFYFTTGTMQSLQVSGFIGTAFNFIGSTTPGYVAVLASGGTINSLQISNSYFFGPLQGALYSVGATITTLSVSNTSLQSNTSVGNVAWSIGSATNVMLMGDWSHGFTGIYGCAGTCTNVTTTGSYNN